MKPFLLLAIIAFTQLSTFARATEPAKDISNMTVSPNKEHREEMAKAHEQMAKCLRSDQEIKICHEALRIECGTLMGGMCSGMGKGKHKGMKHVK